MIRTSHYPEGLPTMEDAVRYANLAPGLVPCSRYGRDSETVAPAAYAAAVIVYCETGNGDNFYDTLGHCLSLVVNDHDDPEYLIRNYGAEYGFDADEILPDQS